ncbi:MAG TPA: hypothetical protein VL947_12595, partial [Cytophagales bacterium]|nr:hypothetical protein [Cytophagales bacterium]
MYISVALIAQQTAPSLDQIFLENKYRLPMPHDLIFVREGAAYVELTPDKLLYHDTKTGKRIDSIVFALSLGQVQD